MYLDYCYVLPICYYAYLLFLTSPSFFFIEQSTLTKSGNHIQTFTELLIMRSYICLYIELILLHSNNIGQKFDNTLHTLIQSYDRRIYFNSSVLLYGTQLIYFSLNIYITHTFKAVSLSL